MLCCLYFTSIKKNLRLTTQILGKFLYVGKIFVYRETQAFSLGHVKFEMPATYSDKAGFRNPELRGKFRTGEVNLGVISIGMTFKD